MRVEVEGLAKQHGRGPSSVAALRGVSFDVEGPTTVAVVGPSGSGKSTLLHLLGGLDTASEGHIRVDGEDIGALRGRALVDHRASVGFVVQRYNLLPALTALENVAMPLLPRRPGPETWDRARELLERVGLADREKALPGELSGGEQQRVAIARSLIGRPRLVLADEPTGNLDTATAREVVDLLIEVVVEGATLLVATHDLAVAERCDRIITLTDGHVASDTGTG